jgi:NAD(P)H dehydrogenase (quinone)
MAKILVLYYSSYGHVEALAQAIAAGAQSVAMAEVTLKRVPELVPHDVAAAAHFKLDQPAPIAVPNELVAYDAVIFGTPTRFGGMAAQMKNFLDQTGGIWMKGALVGKVASVFVSTATQHGGQEATILSFHATLLHHGMILVGLPYTFPGHSRLDEITGGGPYGAGTIAGVDGSRQPSANELVGARFQGRHVAETATALVTGRKAA